jgi:3-dehydroquinate dehydratase II
MKVSVINGPNLNLLGTRDPDHYGEQSLREIGDGLKQAFPEIEFHFFQSNIEGEIINQIQSLPDNFDGLIINPGGYAHTSVSIRDALREVEIPKIEVHLSNIAAREDFRQTLLTAAVCNGYISGFKEKGYYAAVTLLKSILEDYGGKT